MTCDLDQIKSRRIRAVTVSEIIRSTELGDDSNSLLSQADLPQCNQVSQNRPSIIMAPSQRHQSHVQIRRQHTRRHKCDSADKMTAKKLHRLRVRKGLIAVSMERALFTPPLQGQGASAFRGDVIANSNNSGNEQRREHASITVTFV